MSEKLFSDGARERVNEQEVFGNEKSRPDEWSAEEEEAPTVNMETDGR